MASIPPDWFLKPQYQSKKGRRPPFYPLASSTHIDDKSLENLELGDNPDIAKWRTPEGIARGGLRGWNQEHEEVTRWLYRFNSPCLVDPRYPNEHSMHLSELAFAARTRGRKNLEDTAELVASQMNNDPEFDKKYVQPWKRLSRMEREDLLLSALSSFETPQDALSGEDSTYSKNRKLMPELELDKLCSNDGQGLLDFFKKIALYALDPKRLSTHPIPDEDVFRKFGIVNDDSIPLSSADRAFQDEYFLRRHVLLFVITQAILSKLSGKPLKRAPMQTSSYRSEITRANLPSLADQFSKGTSKDTIRQGFDNLSEEQCSGCGRTARDVRRQRLLFCQRCKKIDRVQPYCSAECQRLDWNQHKTVGHCGQKLSAFTRIPHITSDPTPPTRNPIEHPGRRALLRILDDHPNEFWFYHMKRSDRTLLGSVGFRDPDPVVEKRIRKALRQLAYQALRDGDQASIDLLAATVIMSQAAALAELRMREPGDKRGPSEEKTKAFRSLFDLEDDTKWNECIERGKKELEKPEREVIREFCHHEQKCLRAQYADMISGPGGMKEGAPPEAGALMRLIFMVSCKEQVGFTDEEIAESVQNLNTTVEKGNLSKELIEKRSLDKDGAPRQCLIV